VNLIIQPEAGLAPVVRAVQKAKRAIDIAIFRLDQAEIEKALGAAVQRGVKVRVLVAHTNRGGEARLRKLEQRLLEAGVAEEALDRIMGPCGLDIGADTQEETALSIMGEILAVRGQRGGGFLKDAKKRIHVEVE